MKRALSDTRLFVFGSGKARALVSSDGQAPIPLETATPAGYILTVPGGAVRLFDAVKGLTRWAVKLIYLFPLLILLKLAAWLLGNDLGDAGA